MAGGSRTEQDAPIPALNGLRGLVVEDRGLIAMKIAQVLRQAGCTVVGPAGTLGAGLDLAQRESLDAALLDIDLRGEPVYPLAEVLRAGGVSFLFLTGYGEMVLPEAWRDAPRLEKPVDPASLREALHRLVTGVRQRGRDQRRYFGDPLPATRIAWETIRRQRDLIMEGRIRIKGDVPGLTKPGS
jgi:DNA-binding response OmpR family regulator